MRRFALLAAAVGCFFLTAVLSAGATPVVTGHAFQHPIGNSGITGHFTFIDNPDTRTIKIRGTARGLTPGPFEVAPGVFLPSRYISLIYDGPASFGPGACLPASEALMGRMLIGVWRVDANGNGVVEATNLLDETLANPFAGPRTYAPLSLIKTVSIRSLPNFDLLACGEVKPGL